MLPRSPRLHANVQSECLKGELIQAIGISSYLSPKIITKSGFTLLNISKFFFIDLEISYAISLFVSFFKLYGTLKSILKPFFKTSLYVLPLLLS